MKSNSSLKQTKFDFLNFLKPCLIACLIVVFLASLVWGIWGFNQGFDFTGGTQLVVSFPYDQQIQTQEGLDKTSNQINKILNKHGIKINSLQVQGEVYETCLVYTFKDVKDDTLRQVRLEINEQFNTSNKYAELVESNAEYKILDDENYNGFDITNQTTQIESMISPTAVILTIASLLFALIVAMIYACFRFKTASALTLAFAGVLNIVLTGAIVLLSRIQINTYFFGVLGLTLLVSVYLSADLLFNIKQKAKDPMLTDKTNHELALSVVTENLTRTIIVGVACAVVAIIVGIVGTINVLHVALTSVVGMAVCVATHLFVIPAFWASINKKRELVRPSAVVNNTDDNAEVIEVEENADDKDAEVVEVEDKK